MACLIIVIIVSMYNDRTIMLITLIMFVIIMLNIGS